MRPLFCQEHGEVMRAEFKSSPPEATVVMFCPYCGRELLDEIDQLVGSEPAASFAEWAEHYDGEILSMPPVRLDDEERP